VSTVVCSVDTCLICQVDCLELGVCYSCIVIVVLLIVSELNAVSSVLSSLIRVCESLLVVWQLVMVIC